MVYKPQFHLRQVTTLPFKTTPTRQETLSIANIQAADSNSFFGDLPMLPRTRITHRYVSKTSIDPSVLLWKEKFLIFRAETSPWC